MMKLKDFLFTIDRMKPNFISDLMTSNKIRPDVRSEADFTKMEKNLLATASRVYYEMQYNSYISVCSCLHQSMKWHHAVRVNFDFIQDHEARIE